VDGVRVNPHLVIPETELAWRFSASGGPGGQHANTSNTRAELLFDVLDSQTLSDAQKGRVAARLGTEIRVVADTERSQLRNRDLARARFAERLSAALHVPRVRRSTKPTKGSVERRLQGKARTSERKAQRRSGWD
jgi:ribosome-associated protein